MVVGLTTNKIDALSSLLYEREFYWPGTGSLIKSDGDQQVLLGNVIYTARDHIIINKYGRRRTTD
jgi:hypothetical protein